MYGTAFSAMWAHSDLQEVKALWTEKLGGFGGVSIGAALKDCDDRPYPPNLPEFIGLCREAAKRLPPMSSALPAPSMEKVKFEFKKINLNIGSGGLVPPNPLDWAKRIKERYEAGEELLLCQTKMASEALGEKWPTKQKLDRKQVSSGERLAV